MEAIPLRIIGLKRGVLTCVQDEFNAPDSADINTILISEEILGMSVSNTPQFLEESIAIIGDKTYDINYVNCVRVVVGNQRGILVDTHLEYKISIMEIN